MKADQNGMMEYWNVAKKVFFHYSNNPSFP